MALVERRSQREVARLTGLARDTMARAVRADVSPRYERAPMGSKLDPFKEWICEQL
jgi:transposase